MGYELRAVIASAGLLKAELLKAEEEHLAHSVRVPLEQGLAMLLITDEFYDCVVQAASPAAGRVHGLRFLPDGFAPTLADWSYRGPVAFVFADFFGGVGSQEAAVWVDGKFIVGPLHLTPSEKFGPAGSPISQALRRLGVVAQPGSDEFEAAGLRRHRRILDWIS